MDFSEFLKPYLNKKIKNYYVALSGGADSIVLLNELIKIQRDFDLNLTAIHINHNIQKDSKKWKDICADFCKKNEIKFIHRTLLRKKNLEMKGTKSLKRL